MKRITIEVTDNEWDIISEFATECSMTETEALDDIIDEFVDSYRSLLSDY